MNPFKRAGSRLGDYLTSGGYLGKSKGSKGAKFQKPTRSAGPSKSKGMAPKKSSRPKARPKRKMVGKGT